MGEKNIYRVIKMLLRIILITTKNFGNKKFIFKNEFLFKRMTKISLPDDIFTCDVFITGMF